VRSPFEPVVVVGGGVSGLTTAICLAEAGCRVHLWTAEPPHRTTSVVAGGLWGPSFQEPIANTMAWTEISLREFTAPRGRSGDWRAARARSCRRCAADRR
jgi:D-amino-acid oxidase